MECWCDGFEWTKGNFRKVSFKLWLYRNIWSKQRTKIFSIYFNKNPILFKSNKNIYLQAIDDEQGKTLISESSLSDKKSVNIQDAIQVGKRFAKSAKEMNLTHFVFDRAYWPYKGKIKAMVDAIRSEDIVI